ncbi:MAG: helix-turn-helix domain-containing protein [bacterium]|nr:helix-turn-helix domain-containing protein [bacterium]
MEEKLLKISEAAEIIGVSIDTLRRWDESGKLPAIRKEGSAHRYYREKDIEIFASDLFKLASEWINKGTELPGAFYCPTSDIFRARLVKMERMLMEKPGFEKLYSLIVLVAGEIGDNSFAHNLGKWPDIPGTFFGYDIKKGIIVLADRGLGILATLSRVRPDLSTHIKAVEVAFTEFISGRAPEKRGNGLKLVREVILTNPIDLFFTSGDAEIRMKGANKFFGVTRGPNMVRGCMAKIEF